jgi:hypothetical protein
MMQHACQSPQVPEVESPFGTAAPPSQLADESSEVRASIAPANEGGGRTEQEKGVKDTAEASAQRDGVRGEKEATAHAHAVAGADGDWHSVVHAETGGTYYWNTKTNQTSWARPLALAGTSYCTGHSAAAATTHVTVTALAFLGIQQQLEEKFGIRSVPLLQPQQVDKLNQTYT